MTKTQNIVVQKIKNGDESYFRLVFNDYYKPLVKFAVSYLNSRNDAEDVVQSVFIQLWEKADQLESIESFDAYLFKCVKNQCLNRLKKLKVEDQYHLLMAEGLLNAQVDDGRMSPALQNRLQEAIEQLPEGIRKIIQLKYIENLKITEISEFLKISENTVKTQLKRGKQKLREGLKITG